MIQHDVAQYKKDYEAKLIYYYYLYCTSIVYFIFYIQLKNKKMTKKNYNQILLFLHFFLLFIFLKHLEPVHLQIS